MLYGIFFVAVGLSLLSLIVYTTDGIEGLKELWLFILVVVLTIMIIFGTAIIISKI